MLKVGVTKPKVGNRFSFFALKSILSYLRAEAIQLTFDREVDLESLDSIILSGGSDIDPTLYGESANSHNTKLDRERDRYEFEILEFALSRDIPVLGICRGAQLINIYLGGTLHPTILSFDEELIHKNSIFPIKSVSIKSSKLKDILNQESIIVNSLHNQAIDRVGDSLRAIAFSERNLIQAIESSEFKFLIGVQWHPEYLPYIKSQLRLFRELLRYSIKSGD